jgi:hypothetical protein
MNTTTATKPVLPLMTWGFDNDGDQDGDTSFEWECFCDNLTELMEKINKGGKWFCTVENFGWQSRNGYKAFSATKGRSLLSAILPNTDCSFKVFVEGKGFGRYIKIQNFHHDSPHGREIYCVRKWSGKKHPPI